MRRWLAILLVALLSMLSFTAEAAETRPFSVALSASEGRSEFDLELSYDGTSLGAFVFRVDFDAGRFTCQPVRLADGLKNNYVTALEPHEGQMAVVYTQKNAGQAFSGSGTAITCRFRVKEDASPGPADFRVRVEQVLSSDGESLSGMDETLSYNVSEPISTDCALLSLTPSTGELDQPFSPDMFAYTMSVPYSVARLTFDAEPVEGAAYKVNRQTLGAEGSTTRFEIAVTAADGKTKQTYQVDVYREPRSSDCTLQWLAPDEGEFDQTFSPDRLNYTMTVPTNVTSLTFTYETAEGAKCTVSRKTLGAEGSTTRFEITVTAADGKTKRTYQVDVYREPRSSDCTLQWLAPDEGEFDQTFSPDRLNYTMTVPTNVTFLTFTYEAAEGAKCTVNRKNLGAAGSETEFRFTVTAEDAKTKEIYRVTVYREPLSGEALLRFLAPDTGKFEQEFSPTRYHYTMTVASDVTEMGFTATPIDGATCKVDGKKLGDLGSTTTFKITVTAEDGKTKQVYEVDVTREDDPDAHDCTLLSLTPATGELEPDFSPDITDYTLTVPYSVPSMTFEAETAEGASWKVNRKNLGSGGSNTEFQITVTAADKKTKQTYRVTVHREEQVKTTASPTPKATAASTPKAVTVTVTPTPTKTPKPTTTPKPSPSPSAIPVPVEEDSVAITPPPLGIRDVQEDASAEKGVSPFAYAGFTGLAAAAIFLSGPISRWFENHHDK